MHDSPDAAASETADKRSPEPVTSGRNLSVRLPADLLETVLSIARVQNLTMGEVVRNAIRAYSDQLVHESEFQEQLELMQKQLEALRPPVR